MRGSRERPGCPGAEGSSSPARHARTARAGLGSPGAARSLVFGLAAEVRIEAHQLVLVARDDRLLVPALAAATVTIWIELVVTLARFRDRDWSLRPTQYGAIARDQTKP